MKRISQRIWTVLFLAGMGWSLTGCKTEDELSTRPWNTPKSWETGLPAVLTEGR